MSEPSAVSESWRASSEAWYRSMAERFFFEKCNSACGRRTPKILGASERRVSPRPFRRHLSDPLHPLLDVNRRQEKIKKSLKLIRARQSTSSEVIERSTMCLRPWCSSVCRASSAFASASYSLGRATANTTYGKYSSGLSSCGPCGYDLYSYSLQIGCSY